MSSSFLAAPPFDAAVEKLRILAEIGLRQGLESRVSFCETKIRNLSIAATRNIYQIAAIFGWLEHNAPAVVARLRHEEEQQYDAMMLSRATTALKEQEMVKKIDAINRRFRNEFDWNFGEHQPTAWSGEMLDKMRRLAGIAEEQRVLAVEVKRRLKQQVVARLRNAGRHTKRDPVLMTTDILAVTTAMQGEPSSAGLAKAPVEDGSEVQGTAAGLASAAAAAAAVASSSFVTEAMEQGTPGSELPTYLEAVVSGNAGRSSSATLGRESEGGGQENGEEEENGEQPAAATSGKRKAAPEDGFAIGAQGAGAKGMKKGKGRSQPSPQVGEKETEQGRSQPRPQVGEKESQPSPQVEVAEMEIEQGRSANAAAPPPPPASGMRQAMLSLLEGQYLRDQAALEEYMARDASSSDVGSVLEDRRRKAQLSRSLWMEMTERMGDGGEYAYFG
ncbi:hypothetical protein AC579_181 [Pseudocercospora musae]|uniref:Uncharacterized protein n=1 Tax=Pseudocercospora musae TaxID=113226 RepID=A0A139I184_9PEZI|nr:hypothetical protein AC579_181 [Pseudocercospora musae]